VEKGGKGARLNIYFRPHELMNGTDSTTVNCRQELVEVIFPRG